MEYQGLVLDTFQEEAVKAIGAGKSLIVSAPTGCGKTLIAEYAVEEARRLNRKVVYTAPIKALSNQKFRDFRRQFGDEVVGIHTGDVTINPEAPLLIMTTEILRNLILEDSSRLQDIYYAVFDEIHFIDDEERGTVWEESIILAPKEIRFLCLSATVPNIEHLAAWMGEVRDTIFEVIIEKERPIPLRHHLFSTKYGTMSMKAVKKKFREKPSERKKFLRGKPNPRKIIKHVLKDGKFPVLYFCFNRRACERNAELHVQQWTLNDEDREKISIMVDDLVKQYNLEGYERLESMRRLWVDGCAYHHAGILPAAKEIVERLFTTGLIRILFCTETFALGVNMPASAVIFDQLEKFNGVDFQYLSSRHYQQMAGRAGRRGMDTEGNVYSLVVPEATNPREVERIFYGKSEPVRSRFFASYSTILNIYSQYGEDSYEVFRKSLRNYGTQGFILSQSYIKEEEQIKNRIKFLQSAGFLEGTNLTEKGILAAKVNGYEIQAAELYYSRAFDNLSAQEICVLLAGIVTEERKKRADLPRLTFKFHGEKVLRKLRNLEMKHNIAHPIRKLDLTFAPAVYSWANDCSLKELESFGIPEGDLVRLFRMVIQLLRTLRAELEDPVISDKMHEALAYINRGVVDAQAELEIG